MNILSIDLGGTQIKLGLFLKGKMIAKRSIPAYEENGLEHRLAEIEGQVSEMLGGQMVESLDGVALGFPGIVDTAGNKIVSTPKYLDATEIDLVRWIRIRWACSTQMDNDSRLACIGEWKAGAGKGQDNLVMVTLGTGFGSSAVIGGKVLRGVHHQAGILGGHATIQYKGEPCICGNRGCVETLASSWSLSRIIKNFNAESEVPYIGKATYKALFDSYRQGDEGAEGIVNRSIEAWSAAIVNLIHYYDPETIIIGGGLMGSRDIIIPGIEEWVRKHAWLSWGMVKIKAAYLGNEAALYGGYHLFTSGLESIGD